MALNLSAPVFEDPIDSINNDTSDGMILASVEPYLNPIDRPLANYNSTGSSTSITEDSSAFVGSLEEGTLEDEDQDMSDGGVTLQTTFPPLAHVNSELDTAPATLLDWNNLTQQPGGGSYAHVPDGINTTDLPAVMSEVTQQLQNIQDDQEHGGFELSVEHDIFMNPIQSTESLPLPSSSYSQGVSSIALHHSQLSLGMASVLPSNEHTGSWSYFPFPAFSVLNVGQHAISHLPSSDQITGDDDQDSDADHAEVEDQINNNNLGTFLAEWARDAHPRSGRERRYRGPSQPSITRHVLESNLEPVRRCDLQGDECDIQRIDWKDLGVSRLEARQRRRQTYRNYTNLRHDNAPLWHNKLPNEENYFKFRRLDFQHDIHLTHFQLRNLIACPSQDRIFYAGVSKIMHYNPAVKSPPKHIMDMRNPQAQSIHSSTEGVQISTLTCAHDILVAGGFAGEYGLLNIRAKEGTRHSEGIITHHNNNITNHAQVHLSRHSSSPLVTFASNDSGVRTLDVTTNKFISEDMYDHAINCTAVSPDQRLRVMVGDTRKVMICNSDTGEILQELDGHRDYGFACDWSEDGWTMATGNQDMQIKIWDARKWTNSSGIGLPVATIAAEMAGVRKLKFSPIGSGRKVLVAAEPVDFVNVIDATTFGNKQTLSFFGEIGGLDFTNDGQDLIVANCDGMRGGIMEFERCDFASEGLCGSNEEFRGRIVGKKRGFDHSTVSEDSNDRSESRGVIKRRERRAALLTTIDHF